MLGRKKNNTSVRLVKGVSVPITQLSFKELAGQESPDRVAPVVIQALAPTLDKSLKSDRSLCPFRALCYSLYRTSDLRQDSLL